MLLLPLSNFWNKLSTDSGFYRRVGREMALLLGGVRTSLQHFWGRRAEWRAIWFPEMRLIILACKKVFCFLVSLERRIDCVVSSSCHRNKWNSSLLQHLKRTHEAEHRWKTSAAAERKLLQNGAFSNEKTKRTHFMSRAKRMFKVLGSVLHHTNTSTNICVQPKVFFGYYLAESECLL